MGDSGNGKLIGWFKVDGYLKCTHARLSETSEHQLLKDKVSLVLVMRSSNTIHPSIPLSIHPLWDETS